MYVERDKTGLDTDAPIIRHKSRRMSALSLFYKSSVEDHILLQVRYSNAPECYSSLMTIGFVLDYQTEVKVFLLLHVPSLLDLDGM